MDWHGPSIFNQHFFLSSPRILTNRVHLPGLGNFSTWESSPAIGFGSVLYFWKVPTKNALHMIKWVARRVPVPKWVREWLPLNRTPAVYRSVHPFIYCALCEHSSSGVMSWSQSLIAQKREEAHLMLHAWLNLMFKKIEHTFLLTFIIA